MIAQEPGQQQQQLLAGAKPAWGSTSSLSARENHSKTSQLTLSHKSWLDERDLRAKPP